MKMSPLDESVESDPDLLGAEVGQSVFPNVERVDAGISLLIELLTKSLSKKFKVQPFSLVLSFFLLFLAV